MDLPPGYVAARERVINSMRAEGEEAGRAFDELGIGITNNDGTLRDATEVLFEYVDALNQIQDPTARAAAAEEVLGKNWRAMQPLIEAGSAAYKDMAEEGRQVAVVDAQRVQSLSDLNDAQQKLDAQLEKSRETMLAELAPAFQTVAEAMGTAVSAFNDFLASEEGQAAFQALADAVSDLIGSFLGDDNGAGTFASIVEAAKNAVEAFTTALNWIMDHGDAVKTALTALGLAWAGLNVAPSVMEFLHLIKEIPTSKITSALGAGSGTAATGGTGAVGNALGLAGRVALTGAAIYGADQVWEKGLGQRSAIKDIGYNLGIYDYQAHSESGQEMYNSIKQAVTDGMDAALFTQQKYGSADIGKTYQETVDTMERLQAKGAKVNESQVLENLYRELENLAQKAQEQGKAAGDNYATTMQTGITEGTAGIEQAAEAAGENASVGLANGINARADEAIAAAQSLAEQVAATMEAALDIHSPSKVMEQLGEYVGLGFAQGIDSQMGAVERAMDGMISATQRTPARPMAAHPMQAAGPRRVVLQIDKTQLCEVLVDDMDTALGAVVRNRR